ncbi:TolC family outer membrane protein [Pigmentiphaga sp.]|nr:TolC family outer membrane protein [Pigmentiphaga sp.]MBX6318128.1 TolC family outer membrane protein [Pigmentiphaga sp.]
MAAALAAAPAPGCAEDLYEIYRMAREADPTLAASDATRKATHEGVNAARSAFLPQVNATYTAARQNTGESTTAPTEFNNTWLLYSSTYTRGRSSAAGISLDIQLFNWSNVTTLRGAQASAVGADYSYDAASQDLAVRTVEAYFNVLTTSEQLEFSEAYEKALALQLKQARELYQAGMATVTDVHQAQAQYDNAVAQSITARNSVQMARESLSQIIGKDFGPLKPLRDRIPLLRPDPDDMEAWVRLAYERNPQLAAADKSVEAADYKVKTAASGHLPTLTGTIRRTMTRVWGTETGETIPPGYEYSWTRTGNTLVGVTLTIPIYAGGLTTAQTREAMYQRYAAQDQREAVRRAVAANARNAYRSVISGISQVEATRAAVESAQSALDASVASYRAGSKTILDILTSQANLLNAKIAYSVARHQLVFSNLLLKQASGILGESDVVAINALLQ